MAYEKENTRNCLECSENFNPKSHNAKYCKQPITIDCSYCSKDIETICSNYKKQYCNSSCRNKLMRATRYKISEMRTCVICFETFEPEGSAQIICSKDHEKDCEFCETSYKINNQRFLRGDNKYCDNICSTLDQTNSQIFKNKISEYKEIDTWAKDFKKSLNRKPTKHETSVYFNVDRIPPRADRSLFNLKKESRFEYLVATHVEKILSELNQSLKVDAFSENIEIIRNYRPNLDGKKLELDIYVSVINIGFEVQDFKTHSRIETVEKDSFGKLMKGPKYHENKRLHFEKLGIKVIEIWEDEIKGGEYKEIVESFIKTSLARI